MYKKDYVASLKCITFFAGHSSPSSLSKPILFEFTVGLFTVTVYGYHRILYGGLTGSNRTVTVP